MITIKLIPLVVYFSKFLGKHKDFCSKENQFAMDTFKRNILEGVSMESIYQSFKESCYKTYDSQWCIDQGLKYHKTWINNIVNDSEFSSRICPIGNSVLYYANSGEDCTYCIHMIETMDNFANWAIRKAGGDYLCKNFIQ